MKFEDALAIVLQWEGGFSNHSKDPGGATNLGITHQTLSSWRGNPVSVEDVRGLVVADAAPIYRSLYWEDCRCPEMPQGVDLMLFDCAVNQGSARAKRLLQRSLKVSEDGIIGPVTMKAVLGTDPGRLVDELASRRAVHYASLHSDFHLGWFRRLTGIHRHALGRSC